MIAKAARIYFMHAIEYPFKIHKKMFVCHLYTQNVM